MAGRNQEIEIKLALPDVATAGRLLRAAGFHIAKRRVFEANTVYDTDGRTLIDSRQLLRLREVRGNAIVTFKGPPVPGKHKSREELEATVSDAKRMGLIFERLGFRPFFRYEKYRTEYQQLRSRAVATIDETPIGIFIELEGSSAWIDRTARKLGFAESEYITVSYGSLYRRWCELQGIPPGDMVFR
jgi:adenylate cyclase class 2